MPHNKVVTNRRELKKSLSGVQDGKSEQTNKRHLLGRASRLAWLPIPLLLIMLVVLLTTDIQSSFDSSALVMVLNFFTRTLACVLIAYLAGRSFLVHGSLGLLLLGCGVAIWGCTGFIGSWSSSFTWDANIVITITNVGILLSGLCHILGVSIETRSKHAVQATGFWLIVGYTLVLGTVGLIIQATMAGWLPVFFIDGEGGTLARYIVLGTSLALFIGTSFLLWRRNRPSLSSFAYWYGLALMLIAVNILGMMVQSHVSSLLNWINRAGQYLGGVYMFIAAVVSVRESGVQEISLKTRLKDVQEQHARLFELAADGIVINEFTGENVYGNFTEANPAICHLLGYTEQEMGELTYFDIAAAEDRQAIAADRERLINDRLLRQEKTLVAKDGRQIPCEISTQLFEKENRPMVMSVIRDISERKRAEEERARTNEKLDHVLRSIQDDFYVLDRDWTFVFASRNFTSRIGKEPEDFIGKSIWEMFPNHIGTVIDENFRATMENREVRRFEMPGKYTDAWYSMTSFPSPEGITVLGADITERKQAEAEVQRLLTTFQEERNRLSALVSSIQDEVWFADTEKRFTLANPSALREFGLGGSNEIDIRKFAESLEVYRPDGSPRPVDEAPSLRALKGETVRNQEEKIRTPGSGELRWREVNAAPVEDAAGSIIGSVAVVRDITERKQTEEKIQESEERFRNLANAIPQLAWNAESDGYIFWYNQRWYDYTGTTPEEMEGWGWQRVHDQKVLPEVLKKWKDSIATGLPFEMVFPLRRADGEFRPFLTRGMPLRDSSGKVNEWVGTNTDITEQRRMEEELRNSRDELERRVQERTEQLANSEKEFRLLAEAMPQIVWITRADGSNIYFNQQWVDYTGLTLEESYGHGWNKPFHPDDQQRAWDAWQNAVTRNGTYSMECRLRKADGTYRWWLIRGVPVIDEKGEISKWFGTCTDIEEIKRKEEAVQRVNAYNRSLIEASLDPLVTIDRAGKISDVNSATERITGYPREKLIGTDFSDYFTDSKRAKVGYLLVFQDGVVKDYELEILHKDGHTTPVLYNASVYKDEDGKVVGVFAAARDIAERRKLEEQLRQSQKMEAIGTLAGGIAHDFNNMLAAILGFTEMALEDIPDRPDVERNLQNVSKAAMRARDLVKQILAFSRKTGHERNPLSLTPLVKETVQLLRASIPTTIEIKFTATATSDIVLAAPVEIQQILMNLATNASLAMQEKGGTLGVSLTDIDFEPDSPVFGADVSPGEYVQLVVRDTGMGMSPDVMKRVFEPFFTTREVGKGTGMGLAVVYGIVKDLQGTITVESELGVGSTFSVLLPKVKTDAQAEATQPVEAPGGSERILFVDDEEMLVEWGRATLERLGYTVTAMTDSREALKTFSIDPSLFDLVITDYAMPRMAGGQLTKELLKIRRDTPVILCTGHSDNISPETSREMGVKEFLTKPVSKQELAEAVRRALDGKDRRAK